MKSYQFSYRTATLNELNDEQQLLIKEAAEAAAIAYAPYSGFRVGAAVLMDDGMVIRGANLENASYPAGICAERAALSNLNLNSEMKVKSIAINYLGGNEDGKPLSPCGVCRQFILEVQLHQQWPIAVYMSCPTGETIVVEDASMLLPFHFSSHNL